MHGSRIRDIDLTCDTYMLSLKCQCSWSIKSAVKNRAISLGIVAIKSGDSTKLRGINSLRIKDFVASLLFHHKITVLSFTTRSRLR
jgi:hypothetical protein